VNAIAEDPCPDPAVLGAFIDGTLSRERVANVTSHVSRCAACRVLVENVAELELELEQPVIARGKRFRWLAAVAAIVPVVIGVAVFRTRQETPSDPIAKLVAASPTSARTLEPRLSGGFPWARLRPVRRAGVATKTPEDLVASGAAGAVLREVEGQDSPQALHASGVAYLVARDARAAVPLLEEAARRAEGNARVWSDLSAALYDAADPGDVVTQRRALAAAERAIRLNPRLVEAYFNRALILEHVGTPQQAAAAWRAYLDRDVAANGWSAEARERFADVSEH
jgi:hypothetical protein